MGLLSTLGDLYTHYTPTGIIGKYAYDTFKGPNNQPLLDAQHKQVQRTQGLDDSAHAQLGAFDNSIKDSNGLVTDLNGVIAGTAPSVAQNQLIAGMEHAQRAQLAQASGATGANGALAAMNAARNSGNIAADVNQQAGLLRAKEIADARAQKGVTLSQIAHATGNVYGNELSAAGQANGQSNALLTAYQAAEAAKNKQRQELILSAVRAAGSALIPGA